MAVLIFRGFHELDEGFFTIRGAVVQSVLVLFIEIPNFPGFIKDRLLLG